MKEQLAYKSRLTIGKFVDPDGRVAAASQAGASFQELLAQFPDRYVTKEEHEGNILVYSGITGVWKLVAGLASPPGAWSNANAKLRVGTGSGSATKSDTADTFTNPVDKGMDTGYPMLVGTDNDTCAWKATFGPSDANQAWNEFGVINSDTTPVLLNRFVTSKGTKASGETWTLEIQIQLS
ncbi:MAG: hypothetical protein QXT73_00855 [Candidatus Methanomethylicaceae archaeon]